MEKNVFFSIQTKEKKKRRRSASKKEAGGDAEHVFVSILYLAYSLRVYGYSNPKYTRDIGKPKLVYYFQVKMIWQVLIFFWRWPQQRSRVLFVHKHACTIRQSAAFEILQWKGKNGIKQTLLKDDYRMLYGIGFCLQNCCGQCNNFMVSTIIYINWQICRSLRSIGHLNHEIKMKNRSLWAINSNKKIS